MLHILRKGILEKTAGEVQLFSVPCVPSGEVQNDNVWKGLIQETLTSEWPVQLWTSWITNILTFIPFFPFFFLSPFFSFFFFFFFSFCSCSLSPLCLFQPSLQLFVFFFLSVCFTIILFCVRGHLQGGSSLSSSVTSSSARRVRQLPQLPPKSSTVEQGMYSRWCLKLTLFICPGERYFIVSVLSRSLCCTGMMQHHSVIIVILNPTPAESQQSN